MHQPPKAVGEQPRIAIIGAGFGGLGMAIRLKLAGYTQLNGKIKQRIMNPSLLQELIGFFLNDPSARVKVLIDTMAKSH